MTSGRGGVGGGDHGGGLRDQAAFADFYGARRDAVVRAVLVAVGDRAVAEDAVAEAFARAYARWRRVAEHPNPTAWVLRTALNDQRSWWRRSRREVSAAPPERASTDESGRLPGDLKDLVARLPRRQREVDALRVLADLSAEETAALLGIAPATVHVHLHRALATLRESPPSWRRRTRPEAVGSRLVAWRTRRRPERSLSGI